MKVFAVLSMVVVSVVAQHPAELTFDATDAIQRLHQAYYARFPTPAPPVNQVRAVPVQPLPTPRPRQQQAGLLAGHLAGHRAGEQAPHRFEGPPQPIKKWEGPFAHEIPAGVEGSTGHTQFTPEVEAARRFIAQAHLNHIRQKISLNAGEQQI
ncbi:unnamed protein product [Meganyctiphanes norvegica]|uniref:Uncharacterized protein n=1 Tax=Meganyctiphanes norvegica TaxID=48144 RepID=A0AAV2R3G8_MEGNR